MSRPVIRDIIKRRRLQRGKSAQRKKRHVRNTLRGQRIDKIVIITVRKIVHVLYTHHISDGLRFPELRGRHVAHTELANKPLLLGFGKHGKWCFQRPFCGSVPITHVAIVGDIQHIESEIAQVVVHRINEFRT